MVDFLLSPRAQQALAQLGQADLSEAQTVPLLAGLRHTFNPGEAGALLTLARLRQRAAGKFPQAERLYFTVEALEQATAYVIAQHRAAWLDRHAPPGPILELGCGIGGDTLALAQHRPVIAYDTSPARLRFARANAEVLGLSDRIDFRLADWTEVMRADSLPAAAAVFADPARRIQGRRVFSLHEMQPPLNALLGVQKQIPAAGVKVAPGVQDGEIPANCGVEFISHEHICKEAILWFGPLRRATTGRWAAIHSGEQWRRIDASLRPPPVGPLVAGQYLHEPDPAVIRAGAFVELCEMLDAHLFDSQIAYLVGDLPGAGSAAQSFVQTFRIEEILPGSLKQLNLRLQALGVGQVELKKRGSPIEPESLRPRLKLVRAGRDAVVILTRQGDRRLILLGHRV